MPQQSIKKNYILNTLYQILTLVTPLITTPYISRVLGPDGVGAYSYTNSIVTIFSLFACLGTTTYGQRTIAQCRDDVKQRTKAFWEIEVLSCITTIFCLAAWTLFIVVYPEYKFYFIILSFDLLSTALDISWLYAGLERYQFIVMRNSVVKLVGVALVFLLVREKQDVWIYISILTVTKLLGNVSMWAPIRKIVNKVSFKELNLKPHIKETFAYFVPTAAASVYSYLDKVMIGVFSSSTTENGYYEQANRIAKIAYSVVISLNTVMSSRMSYLFSLGKEKEIKDKLENALAFILTLSIPLTFGISGIAQNFVPWFFGDGYDKVVILMLLSSPLVIILSLHNFLSAQYLIPSGQRVRSTKGVLIGAAVNFICNLILIPQFSSIGALIGTLAAETSICIVYWYMSKEYVPLRVLFKYLPKQLLSAFVMLAIVVWIGNGKSGSIVLTVEQALVGAVVYGAMLIILREAFCRKSLHFLLEKVRRRRRKKVNDREGS